MKKEILLILLIGLFLTVLAKFNYDIYTNAVSIENTLESISNDVQYNYLDQRETPQLNPVTVEPLNVPVEEDNQVPVSKWTLIAGAALGVWELLAANVPKLKKWRFTHFVTKFLKKQAKK